MENTSWPADSPAMTDTSTGIREPAVVKELVSDLRAGRASEAGFERLFEDRSTGVTRFFIRRGFSDQEAEDLTQEVFLKVYRNLDSFRLEASFDTWLFRIVSNVWKNAVRGQKTIKRQAESVSLDELEGSGLESPGSADPDGPQDDPLERVLADERTQLLNDALQELPPRMRQVVFFRIGQGLSYREIADLMQVTAATVKTQLREARRRLKPLLEKHVDVFAL